MTLSLLAAQVYALFILIMGISLFTAAPAWNALLEKIKEQKYGVLSWSMVMLPFALFLVLVHNIWLWSPAVIVTVCVWLTLIKAVVYLLFPLWPVNVFLKSPTFMVKYGKIRAIVAIVLGLILVYFTFFDIPDVYMPFWEQMESMQLKMK